MGDGPSTTKTESAQTDPWSGQQPYLLNAFKEASLSLIHI